MKRLALFILLVLLAGSLFAEGSSGTSTLDVVVYLEEEVLPTFQLYVHNTNNYISANTVAASESGTIKNVTLSDNATYALRKGNSITLKFTISQCKMSSVVFSNRGFTISIAATDIVYSEDSSKKFSVGQMKFTANSDYNVIDENNPTNNKVVDIEARGNGITVKYNGYCNSKSSVIDLASFTTVWNGMSNAPTGSYSGDVIMTITEGISYD